MMYTVSFEQINMTNFQVEAPNEEEAEEKAEKLYKKQRYIPSSYVQAGWIVYADGEDK